ncbi:MAG: long-chain-acyl-CoA synthetase [Salinisphaeraceae bacterium]|nr:long-chain-acyl-CoA synthetase [Salinisphaeraceae bacterium]
MVLSRIKERLQPADTISFFELMRGAAKGAPHALTSGVATVKGLSLNKDKVYSIGALLEEQAEKNPRNIAIKYLDRQINYQEFNEQANRIAHYLAERGVGSGDAVAVLMENRPEVLFAVAGVVKLGAVASMINTSQRGDVLVHSLTLVKPKQIIVGAELVEALDEVSKELDEDVRENGRLYMAEEPGQKAPKSYVDLDAELAKQSTENPRTTGEVTLAQPAYYIFTSGTTGLPKASVMSHLRWMRACYAMGQASIHMKPDDVFYCCLPLYHNNALTLAFSSALGVGASLALARKFSASRFWDDILHYDATVFCYIGELCRYLLAQPESPAEKQHRVRACMGNGLRPEIWDEFKERYGIDHINEFYGASEGNLAFTNAFNVDRTAGFCPLPFTIVKYDIEADEPVRDDKGQLIKVKKGENGLLITEVTERMNFEGYTDPEASEKKLLRNVFEEGDCWFNTGDLVKHQGFKHIAFVDRLGDTFRWKGENVATTEVEGAVAAWPQVETACVYGVQVPGADGRAGMAAITPNCDLKDFDLKGFAEELGEALPSYAMPLFLRFREAQEVTGTFKFRKVELKEQGFDPDACGEPVYALVKGEYLPVDAKLFAQIEAGEVKL